MSSYAVSVSISQGSLTVTRPHPSTDEVDSIIDGLIFSVRDPATPVTAVAATITVADAPAPQPLPPVAAADGGGSHEASATAPEPADAPLPDADAPQPVSGPLPG